MRGEFLPVWSETWRDIWSPLARHADAPVDLFSELYRELTEVLVAVPTPEALADVVTNPDRARATFRRTKLPSLRGERAVVEFIERAHGVVVDLGGDPLANRYFLLVEAFLTKFSLRYDLRRPCTLHVTLSGVFARMMRELKEGAQRDAEIQPIYLDFEEAIRDLKADPSERNIKTCIQKQVNLLEALGQKCPSVTSNTLGRICDEVKTWPHAQVREAMQHSLQVHV
jgi:hypothetical protein